MSNDIIPITIRGKVEADRQMRRAHSGAGHAWSVLDEVVDPEIPVLSIWDLGVLQDVKLEEGTVVVTITPTYSGCPAMDVIAQDIGTALSREGYPKHRVIRQLSPAWTTDWISPSAREKLRAYGIAPPRGCMGDEGDSPVCPQCGSEAVRKISEFGSTACKALYKCQACDEPFDYFKVL